MIDPDEFADYEAWREHKLTTSTDLSVQAYNAEMEAAALAYEAGARAAFAGMVARRSEEDVIRENPYRKPGTRGERRGHPGVPSE